MKVIAMAQTVIVGKRAAERNMYTINPRWSTYTFT